MSIRFSTGTRNGIAQGLGFGGLFNRGSIKIYTGAQPASGDAAVTGTLLGTVSVSSATVTAETRATGTITLTGGASGSVNTVIVNTFNIIPSGAVNFNTSLSQTASDLCDAINRDGIYTATVSGAIVTISPRAGAGTSHNGYTVSAGLTTITASYANMASGTAPVAGLVWAPPNAGVLAKPSTAVWGFTGVAAGTAGWFRLVASESDPGTLVTAAPYYVRMDGSIAVSGADLNLSNIAIAVSSPNTIDSLSFTVPAGA